MAESKVIITYTGTKAAELNSIPLPEGLKKRDDKKSTNEFKVDLTLSGTKFNSWLIQLQTKGIDIANEFDVRLSKKTNLFARNDDISSSNILMESLKKIIEHIKPLQPTFAVQASNRIERPIPAFMKARDTDSDTDNTSVSSDEALSKKEKTPANPKDDVTSSPDFKSRRQLIADMFEQKNNNAVPVKKTDDVTPSSDFKSKRQSIVDMLTKNNNSLKNKQEPIPSSVPQKLSTVHQPLVFDQELGYLKNFIMRVRSEDSSFPLKAGEFKGTKSELEQLHQLLSGSQLSEVKTQLRGIVSGILKIPDETASLSAKKEQRVPPVTANPVEEQPDTLQPLKTQINMFNMMAERMGVEKIKQKVTYGTIDELTVIKNHVQEVNEKTVPMPLKNIIQKINTTLDEIQPSLKQNNASDLVSLNASQLKAVKQEEKSTASPTNQPKEDPLLKELKERLAGLKQGGKNSEGEEPSPLKPS